MATTDWKGDCARVTHLPADPHVRTQARSETENAGTLSSDAFKLMSVNLVLVLIP